MRAWTLVSIATLALPAATRAEPTDPNRWEARVYRNANGDTMPYRLFIPDGYDNREKYPLVIYLHGIDAVGNDNVSHITNANFTGSNVWTRASVQARHPCFVLAPQIPFGTIWAAMLTRAPTAEALRVLDIMRVLEREFSIDVDRIYLTGQSLGGFGTFALAAARPELFAAAVPVCGGGNVTKASELAKVPLWVFHTIDDPVILVFESKAMVAAIQKAGGQVKYTEYSLGLHNAWDRAYNDPDMLEWVFAQKRSSR